MSFTTVLTRSNEIRSFEINCGLLDPKYHTNDICQSDSFRELFKQVQSIKGPVLYWFEVCSANDQTQIIQLMKDYKKNNVRALPAFKKKPDPSSRILYVGKVKAAFWGRLITHLGYLKGNGQTQGLQLDGWARQICLELRLNLIPFNAEMTEYLEILEYAFAKQLKPMVGKHK